MEDAARPLPEGWVRQWDPTSHHNFYVDTKANPPRSIWSHPFDDHIFNEQHPESSIRLPHPEEQADETSEEDNGRDGHQAKSSSKGLKKLGRSVKDKLTNTTHEQRVAERQRRREQEQKAFERHQAVRASLIRAAQTGQPQLLGRDAQGRDVFAQPPPVNYGQPSIGYTPYQTGNAYPYGPGTYATPAGPYNRRIGYGYGGGMGLPIAGGLAGGMLLGGLLF